MNITEAINKATGGDPVGGLIPVEVGESTIYVGTPTTEQRNMARTYAGFMADEKLKETPDSYIPSQLDREILSTFIEAAKKQKSLEALYSVGLRKSNDPKSIAWNLAFFNWMVKFIQVASIRDAKGDAVRITFAEYKSAYIEFIDRFNLTKAISDASDQLKEAADPLAIGDSATSSEKKAE